MGEAQAPTRRRSVGQVVQHSDSACGEVLRVCCVVCVSDDRRSTALHTHGAIFKITSNVTEM